MRKKLILVPHYVEAFHCIGPKCEDNCCYGWKVSIDENTFKKYRKVSNTNLKVLLDKNVTRNRSNPSFVDYAKIKMDEKGVCPFLGDEKLCAIHKNLGEKYLSRTCMTYPRVGNIVNGVKEKTLTLSCPEAARVVLLNPNKMEFDELEDDEEIQYTIKSKINTEDIKSANYVEKYFWELRIFSITLIQNREYSLSDRLIILGIFLKNIQDCTSSSDLNKVPLIIDEFNRVIENKELKEELENIPVNLTVQMELMKELNDERATYGFSPNGKKYLNFIYEFLYGLEYKEDSSLEEVVENYEDAYRRYYKPFMNEHEYILENLLVNKIFADLFPLGSKDKVFDSFVHLIVQFSLVKTILIGIAAFHKELNEELTVQLIYSFSRAIEHDTAFLDKILKVIKENGYDSMAFMSILIKN